MAKQRLFILCLLHLIILVVYQSAYARSSADDIIFLDNDSERITPGRYIEAFEDSEGNHSLSDIIDPAFNGTFLRTTQEYPNYGYSSTDYWIRFTVKNLHTEIKTWYLEIDYPHIDTMEIHEVSSDGIKKSHTYGDAFPFNERPISYRNIVHPITIETGDFKEVYIKMYGNYAKQFPVILWRPSAFYKMTIVETFAFGIYFGIIAVMILYNLFLYISIRDRNYMYYVLYIFFFGLIQMAYNGISFQFLWPNSMEWHQISLPFHISLSLVFLSLFAGNFLRVKENSSRMIYGFRLLLIVSLLLAVYSLIGDYLIAIKITTALILLSGFFILYTGIHSMIRGYRPARFFVIAFLALLSGMILIALNKLNFLPRTFLTEYAIQIGSALEVTLLSLAMGDRIKLINQEKKQAQINMMEAQKKFQILLNSTTDIIFSLDTNLNFTIINNALYLHLRIQPTMLEGKHFTELLYKRDSQGNVSQHLIEEKLDQFRQDKIPIVFRAELKSYFSSEPIEMIVSLEFITIEGKEEILGNAMKLKEDILANYLDYEKQEYTIGNQIIIADEITHRLTRNMIKHIDEKEIKMIRIAMRELIINAIEHGNLNISFEDKTRHQKIENYMHFFNERLIDPNYSGKKVYVSYCIKSDRAIFTIEDEGKGFDVKKVIRNMDTLNEELIPHGRGITMAMDIFDEVFYNEKGNHVTMVKYFT